jgi:oligopeptide/dipeptide ABC transporter ATP-binding protein
VTPVLSVENLTVRYPISGGAELTAVDDVDLSIEPGKIIGLVGESGCGKSSLGRVIAGIQRPQRGRIMIDGQEMSDRRRGDDARLVQMVFQDPASALNPALTIGAMLRELLLVHSLVTDRKAADRRAVELLDSVGLSEELLERRPDALSGGQRQRIGIARALALEPRVLIADEAVAALDSVVKKSVVTLLSDIRERMGLTIVFISHDLAVVRRLCDEVAVMYLGRIVERQSTAGLFDEPKHPYTAALLRAQPRIGERLDLARTPALIGDPPSPIELRAGCSFASRCPSVIEICRTTVPEAAWSTDGSLVRCHIPLSR